MRQEAFVARHQDEWRGFERWLDARGAGRRAEGVPRDEEIPTRYRRLCQQLALARRRGYSPRVVEQLQELMQRGHDVLYRAPPPPGRRALRFRR